MRGFEEPGEGADQARGQPLSIMHSDDFWREFASENDENGEQEREDPQPPVPKRVGEESPSQRCQAGVGQGIEHEDGGDRAFNVLFECQPAAGAASSPGTLELQRQWIQTQQDRFRQGAKERNGIQSGKRQRTKGQSWRCLQIVSLGKQLPVF